MPQMVSTISILILFALCKSYIACKTSNGFTTKTIIVEVGSTIEITCTLYPAAINGKNVNASFLNFRKDNSSASFPAIDASNIHIISPLKSRLIINSSTLNDAGFYTCLIEAGNETTTVCTTIVKVGYKPQKSSTHFRCFSNYQTLECTWETEPNTLMTNSTLKEISRIPGSQRVSSIKQCPDVTRGTNNKWSCKWTDSSSPPFIFTRNQFELLVETNTSFGKINGSYKINHREIVRPDKPGKLAVRSKTEDTIELVWLRPAWMEDFKYDLLYQIIVKPQNPQNHFELKVFSVSARTKNVTFKATGLPPNMLYKISVRCRSPFAKGEDMWSENITVVSQTMPDVPYLPPNTTEQAFQVMESNVSRTIVIWWKTVPKEYWNGEEFHYRISINQRDDKRVVNCSVDECQNINDSYAVFNNLLSESTYQFKIFSANKYGSSREFSSIIVDSTENLLHVPEDITVISFPKSGYNISWKPPNTNSAIVKNYTLFWCDGRHYVCEDSIQWKHVTGTSQFLSLEEKKSYQFAVAANSETSTSGMAWAPCIVQNDTPPSIEFFLSSKNSTTLRVSWSLRCKAERVIIKEFHIIYCKVPSQDKDCTGPETTVQIHNSSVEKYDISKLVPSTLYRVYVKIVTRGEPVKSDFMYERTAADGLSSTMIVGIIVGSAVGCAILLIIVYMFIRWMKKKYDLLKRIKVCLPHGLDTPKEFIPGTYPDFEKDLLRHCPYPVQTKQSRGSFTSDTIKNRHGSGNSQYSTISTDELLTKRTKRCDIYRRNPSGDSSSGCSSTEGHDSIDSCHTHQTHVSTDSGAEIDLSLLSVKVQQAQEPTNFILPDVEEKNSNEPISEKEHVCERNLKTGAGSNIARNVSSLYPAYIQPYSKFGVNQIKDGRIHNYSRQCSLAYVSNLANSEPSVAELDSGNNNCDSSSMPYSKLTFSKSLENIDRHENNTNYSKCDIVDRDAVCDVPNTVKFAHFNPIRHQNDARIENTKPFYIGVRTCLADENKVPELKLPTLAENTKATVSNNTVDSMAYSKFDINPSGLLTVDSRTDTKRTAYIPVQQAMLQAINIPHITPRNTCKDTVDKDLSCSNVSLPAEIVVSAIIDPFVEQCAINGSSSTSLDHCNNSFFYANNIGNQDITPFSLICGEPDEKANTSLSDVNLNIDIRPEGNQNCGKTQNEEQMSTDEQSSLKSNYLKGLEVVVSPGNLNYSTASVPEYRFHDQPGKVEPANSKSGYIHFSPVYYV